MTVTVIEPGRLVLVEPDGLDARDIIELGEALIEEHGWVQNDGGNEARGWSIHGAVGEAANRATGSKGKDTQDARPLRDEAARLISEADQGHRTEQDINDSAPSVDEALLAMRRARGAA